MRIRKLRATKSTLTIGIVLFILGGLTPAHAQKTAPICAGESTTISSTVLGESRPIEVYLPQSYKDTSQRFPVIYCLDGEGTAEVAATAIRFLTANLSIPQMPEAIVVGVINTDRNRDMPRPMELGHGSESKFLAFLSSELVPYIEKNYRTAPRRVLLGHSQGGLFVHFVLSQQSPSFDWFISLDAPLAGFDESAPLMNTIQKMIHDDTTRAVRLVSVEATLGWMRDWGKLSDGLQTRDFLKRIELNGETHESMVYKGIYDGLRNIFYDFAPDLKVPNGVFSLQSLDLYYESLSARYGYHISPPLDIYLAVAESAVMQKYGTVAKELLSHAEKKFGPSERIRQLSQEAEKAIQAGGPEPRIAIWAALPKPSAATMEPFLGNWKEERGQVSFVAKNGLVEAHYKATPPGMDPMELPLHFVHQLDDHTLEWGLKNSKGSGVMHFTVTLHGNDSLIGTAEPIDIFGGPPIRKVLFQRVK